MGLRGGVTPYTEPYPSISPLSLSFPPMSDGGGIWGFGVCQMEGKGRGSAVSTRVSGL